jgi:S1-C subfamily serine protease
MTSRNAGPIRAGFADGESDGYAVTNNHVVDHAKSVQVTPLKAKAAQPICEVHQRLHARIIVPAK